MSGAEARSGSGAAASPVPPVAVGRRVPDGSEAPVPPNGLPTVDIDVLELTSEAQTVRDVLLDMLAKKEVGEPSQDVERICALLDPRRKSCSEQQFVNGSPALKMPAEADLKRVIGMFEETDSQSSPLPEAEPAGEPNVCVASKRKFKARPEASGMTTRDRWWW